MTDLIREIYIDIKKAVKTVWDTVKPKPAPLPPPVVMQCPKCGKYDMKYCWYRYSPIFSKWSWFYCDKKNAEIFQCQACGKEGLARKEKDESNNLRK